MRALSHRGRVRLLALLVTCCALVGLLAGCRGDRAVPTSPRPAEDGRAARARPVEVLHRWDRARSRAFAEGDPVALRRLYTAGSEAGRADVRVLRDYLRRGLHVEDLRVQLLAVDVLERDRDRLRLRVTDRIARAVAVGPEGRRPLPRDRASTRVLELRRNAAGTWQVARLRPAGSSRELAR